MTAQNSDRLTMSFPSEREIVITRTFDAPRRLIFEAMTQPEHVRHWYGPSSLTMKSCEIDLRVGGQWRYVVQAPDGSEFAFSGIYQEITPPERIVSTELFEGMPGTDYLATLTLKEQDGKTILINHLLYQSQAHRDGHLHSGMEGGMRESFDRLDEVVNTLDLAERELVLSRTFDAPPELVFKVWTEPNHIDLWWGPSGFRNETFEMDVRPGGRWRYMMHGPDGTDYPNRIVYHEVTPPERLVYTHSSDIENDPDAFHVMVTFVAHEGKTELTMRSRFPTAAQRQAVIAFGAIEGGKQTLSRLDG